MSPKPLKPPASFEVFAVWRIWEPEGPVSFWATRKLAEKELKNMVFGRYEVKPIPVWQDIEAFKESQS